MNALITTVMVVVLAGGCATAPVHGKRSVTATVGSEAAWASQGYTGPTAVPVLLSDGTIAETPEVAAARAAHLATLELSRRTNPDFDDGYYDPRKYGDHLYDIVSHSEDISKSIDAYNALAQRYSAGLALSGAQHATVNARDAAHTQAEALVPWKVKNALAGGYSYETPTEQNKPYTGPLAMLKVLPTGYLDDTQEVAAAKKTHLSALADAQAAGVLWEVKDTQTHPHSWN